MSSYFASLLTIITTTTIATVTTSYYNYPVGYFIFVVNTANAAVDYYYSAATWLI